MDWAEQTEAPTTNRLIAEVMKRFPGRATLAYYEAVHQHLAPHARHQEALLREALSRFKELRASMPADAGWWTAEDRRTFKTMERIAEALGE